jgi:type IV pilus assembly protein PilA
MQPNPLAVPPAPAKKGMPMWLLLLLIGLGGLVLMGGVLSVLAIYGVRKYIAAAKQAEATNALGRIARDAAERYVGGPGEGRVAKTVATKGLCASASRSVPASASAIRGTKYQSTPEEWAVDGQTGAGFACLGFSMDQPQYYQYSYRASGKASPGDAFEAKASGDLNGDGVMSTFTLGGRVQPSGELVVDQTIHKTNPEE